MCLRSVEKELTVTKKMATEIEALSAVLEALEGLGAEDQTWVLDTAASRLALKTGGQQAGGRSAGGPPAFTSRQPRAATNGATAREFVRTKNPRNDVQRIACLAYYLTHYRETATFKSRDLTALNTEAAGPRFNVSRAANNATLQNRYLAAAGSGQKQITPLGEDVVNALPDQAAAAAAESEGRPRRKVSKKGRKPAKRRGNN